MSRFFTIRIVLGLVLTLFIAFVFQYQYEKMNRGKNSENLYQSAEQNHTQEDKVFFNKSGLFDPLPKLQPGDWLASEAGKEDLAGQTFAEFKDGPRNQVTEKQHTIYIQPLGSFSENELAFIHSLQEHVAAFYQLPVKVLEPAHPRELQIKQRVSNQTGKLQLLSTDILHRLSKSIPADAYCVIGLTLTDLYPSDGWNYVFGQASLGSRAGVFSLARYSLSFFGEATTDSKEEKYLFRLRACKVLSHEIGHMFGMQHCIFHNCDLTEQTI